MKINKFGLTNYENAYNIMACIMRFHTRKENGLPQPLLRLRNDRRLSHSEEAAMPPTWESATLRGRERIAASLRSSQ